MGYDKATNPDPPFPSGTVTVRCMCITCFAITTCALGKDGRWKCSACSDWLVSPELAPADRASTPGPDQASSCPSAVSELDPAAARTCDQASTPGPDQASSCPPPASELAPLEPEVSALFDALEKLAGVDTKEPIASPLTPAELDAAREVLERASAIGARLGRKMSPQKKKRARGVLGTLGAAMRAGARFVTDPDAMMAEARDELSRKKLR